MTPTMDVIPQPVLRRSTEDKVIGGVCGGLARYLDVDPVWLRIAFVALALTGSGVLLYILLWIAVPEQKEGDELGARHHLSGTPAAAIIGIALIVFGILGLLNRTIPWLDEMFWPVVLLVAGAALIWGGTRR